MTIRDVVQVSVKPDKLISQRDIFAICRDHFEGTEFDLTVGTAGEFFFCWFCVHGTYNFLFYFRLRILAGQYNDPNRFDATPNEDGVTIEYLRQGKIERSISLFRTM